MRDFSIVVDCSFSLTRTSSEALRVALLLLRTERRAEVSRYLANSRTKEESDQACNPQKVFFEGIWSDFHNPEIHVEVPDDVALIEGFDERNPNMVSR